MSMKSLIESRVTEALAPQHLEVLNESHKHNVPPGAESHFKVTVVSARFEGMNLVERHRQIYSLLSEEMQRKKLHALALHTFTPDEWARKGGAAASPPCLGGSKEK